MPLAQLGQFALPVSNADPSEAFCADSLGLMKPAGLVLHSLTGERKGGWAVRVSGNWRVTFGFVEGHAVNVDYEDCHQEFSC
jgi:hypothetical protein